MCCLRTLIKHILIPLSFASLQIVTVRLQCQNTAVEQKWRCHKTRLIHTCLLHNPPAGTRSMSFPPHARGMSRPPAIPRPPTRRRPQSVVRPTSTSCPSLVPHPPLAQRVRAGLSPSIEPRTRATSRQSSAARRRTVPPTDSITRTQEPQGARHGESSRDRPACQSMQENQNHEGDRMYMPDSVRSVGERV